MVPGYNWRMTCCFVPPHLLRRLAESDPAAARTLVTDERLRRAREVGRGYAVPVAGGPAWTVHTADHTEDLPGRKVRAVGEPESGDAAVDEAAYGITASLALFAEVYGRDSFDGNGAPVSLTVHYGRDYENAFWDGTQLVFGDGDGRVFGRFTRPVDVLAHEFTHAVTEYTAGLVYRDQPGALNESVSDVFAACVKQRLLGQDAAEADWLIGADLFRPGVQARALRDMAAPGTAYDDPALGRDPQVGHLDDFVVTTDDNGGVHLNSGIPNRAFQLAATAIGGPSWEGAGRIWWVALNEAPVGPDIDFAGFAQATVSAAGDHAPAVRRAWQQVGVDPVGARRLRVRRTGGFVGRMVEGAVDLTPADDRTPELESLVGRIDLTSVSRGPGGAHADRFTYEFDLDGAQRTIREQDLTGDLRRVAELVLRPDNLPDR